MRSSRQSAGGSWACALGVALLAGALPAAAVAPAGSPTRTAKADPINIASDQTLIIRGGRVFERLATTARHDHWESLPIGDVVARTGLALRGSAYEAGTLDHDPDRERCVVNLATFDCVTFVETSLAFARMWKTGGRSIHDLAREIERVRYRDGVRDGYVSRLHYTTEWLADNGRRQVILDLGGAMPGAQPRVMPVNFMSSHPASYPELAAPPEWTLLFAAREVALSADTVRYVPRDAVGGAAGALRSGDIVAFTTGLPGLDVSHLGLISQDGEGKPHLLHASPRSGVILDGDLAGYVGGMSKVAGIMAARPLEPQPLEPH
jgi:hypothetical protein